MCLSLYSQRTHGIKPICREDKKCGRAGSKNLISRNLWFVYNPKTHNQKLKKKKKSGYFSFSLNWNARLNFSSQTDNNWKPENTMHLMRLRNNGWYKLLAGTKSGKTTFKTEAKRLRRGGKNTESLMTWVIMTVWSLTQSQTSWVSSLVGLRKHYYTQS